MAHDSSQKTIPAVAVRALMILLFVIWSNAFTAIKHLRELYSPMELILARFLPFAVLSAVYLLSSRKRRDESLDILRSSFLRIAGMGAFGVAGYNYFIYVAQSEIKPGAAALITTLAPLMTMILAIFFLKEKVSWKKTTGILIAFAGLYLVVRYGRVGMGKVTGIANADMKYALIATLAPLCWSVYTILGKKLVRTRSPFLVTCLSSTIGTLPFFFLLDQGFMHKVALMESTHWIALAHLTLLSTMFGFWIWNLALRHLPATSVSSFIYLNPPFAALFGWLFFGEEVTMYFLLGSAIVLAGLYLTQRER